MSRPVNILSESERRKQLPVIVDYSKAKEFKAFKGGTYGGNQTQVEVKPSSKGEHPNIVIEYTLDTDNPEGVAGNSLKKYYPTSPEGIPMLKKAMIAMGHVEVDIFDDPKKNKAIDFEAMAMAANGLPCRVVVGDPREYDGEDRNDVKRILPAAS